MKHDVLHFSERKASMPKGVYDRKAAKERRDKKHVSAPEPTTAKETEVDEDLIRQLEADVATVTEEDISNLEAELSRLDPSDHSNELENAEKRELARLAKRPDCTKLQSAVTMADLGNGVSDLIFLPERGEKVIYERCCSMLANKPWLDTRTLIVEKVDEDSGELRLWDPDVQRVEWTNFRKATEVGHKLYLPPSSGNLPGKKRRRRMKKRGK